MCFLKFNKTDTQAVRDRAPQIYPAKPSGQPALSHGRRRSDGDGGGTQAGYVAFAAQRIHALSKVLSNEDS